MATKTVGYITQVVNKLGKSIRLQTIRRYIGTEVCGEIQAGGNLS